MYVESESLQFHFDFWTSHQSEEAINRFFSNDIIFSMNRMFSMIRTFPIKRFFLIIGFLPMIDFFLIFTKSEKRKYNKSNDVIVCCMDPQWPSGPLRSNHYSKKLIEFLLLIEIFLLIEH